MWTSAMWLTLILKGFTVWGGRSRMGTRLERPRLGCGRVYCLP